MKSVGFFNSHKFWGGGEKLHLEYALEFQKLGYDVYLFCTQNSPLSIKAKQEGLKTVHVSVSKFSFLSPIKVESVKKKFLEFKIDTVIYSSSQDMKMSSLSAHRAGVKRIIYLRGLAVPVKKSIINTYIFKNIITHIVPNSKETEKLIFKYIDKGIGRYQTKVIYHGIEEFESKSLNEQFISDLRNRNKGILIGNAGRLTVQKGQSFLIDVAKYLKLKGVSFTFLIAGAGELKAQLQSKIQEANVTDEVKLLGFVEDMNSFMETIDIFALSSLWEGFGYVLVEAMNHKKPLVAFDISSNPEIFANNKSGYLCPPNDITAFSEALIRLINDEQLRVSMGENGRQEVENKFILKDRILEFEEFIRS